VAICSYCGHPNWIRETAHKEILAVLSKPYDSVVRAFNEYRKKRGGIWKDTVLRDAQCYYTPFILADVNVIAEYEGEYEARITVYRREIRRRYDEERDEYVEEEVWVYDRTVAKMIHVIGRLVNRYHLNILARRSAEARGIVTVAEHFRKTSTTPEKFTNEVAKQPRTMILAAELSFEEGKKLAIDEARDKARNAAERTADSEARSKAEAIAFEYESSDRRAEVSELIPLYKRATTSVESVILSPITLLPVWVLTYEYKNSIYKITFSGWDLKPLVIEEPITTATRIAYHVASGLAAGIAGGLGVSFLLRALRGLKGTEDLLFIGVIALMSGISISLALTKLALRSLRVRYER